MSLRYKANRRNNNEPYEPVCVGEAVNCPLGRGNPAVLFVDNDEITGLLRRKAISSSQ